MTAQLAAVLVGLHALSALFRLAEKVLEEQYAGAAWYAVCTLGLALLTIDTWRLA